MVYVNDMVGIRLYHIVADDLHISCQDNKGDSLLLEQFHLSLFHLSLV